MKSSICRLCGLLLLAAPLAQAQFAYMTNSGTVTLTGYSNPGGSVTISNFVTSIASHVFEFDDNLTNVTISDSVTSIGLFAFLGCYGLSNITIPDSVTNIGPQAFSMCGLTNVAIPASVTELAGNAFFDCPELNAIIVDPQNLFYSSSNGVLFDISQSTLIEAPCGLSGSYTIPASVTNIGEVAFDSCTNLTSVTFPDGVTSIGDEAFFNCPSLTNITIPGSVTNIGVNAFAGCFGLTSVYFNGNAPSADSSSFILNFVNNDPVTMYYLPGRQGWSNIFAGLPAVLWNPTMQTGDGRFGLQNNQFGFDITGSTNIPIKIEACTNLASPIWSPLTNATLTNGTFYFSDPQWTNNPGRFYRISSP